MNYREYFQNYIFTALLSSVLLTITSSVFLSVVLFSFYGDGLLKPSFLNLLLFITGETALLVIVFSFSLSIVTFILLKLFKFSLKKIFSFFFSATFSLLFCLYLGFYVNSNILRYSREMKSYFIDLSIILLSILLFFTIYRLIPSVDSLEKKKYFKIIVFSLSVILITLLFMENPFSKLNNLPTERPQIKREYYNSHGNYLGPVESLSLLKYNIILFSIDTLRADGLSCYGNPHSTSPNIDTLAKDSIVFQNVLAQASWTLPSHMTMFTSLYPSIHGCNSSSMWSKSIDILDDYWITLPEILKNFGYYTASFTDGKLLGPTFNFDQGFDICDDLGGGIKKITKKTIQWLENYSYKKPFFLFLHCYDLHHYNPDFKYERLFLKEDYEGKLKKFKNGSNTLEGRVCSNSFYNLIEDDVTYLRNLYNAEIYKTDLFFREIVSYLKSNNLYDNTIIVITSDHGEEFWEHKETGHGWSLYQTQLKVPLIVKLPTEIHIKKKFQEWVGVIDISPTILDILGIPIPKEFQGTSLKSLITQGIYKQRNFIAEASHLGNQKCIISNGYSLLFNQFPPIGENIFNWKRCLYVWRNILQCSENELYNLVNDPFERENIISKEVELAEEMEKKLFDHTKNSYAKRVKDSSAPPIPLDKKTEEHLKALGYIR